MEKSIGLHALLNASYQFLTYVRLRFGSLLPPNENGVQYSIFRLVKIPSVHLKKVLVHVLSVVIP